MKKLTAFLAILSAGARAQGVDSAEIAGARSQGADSAEIIETRAQGESGAEIVGAGAQAASDMEISDTRTQSIDSAETVGIRAQAASDMKTSDTRTQSIDSVETVGTRAQGANSAEISGAKRIDPDMIRAIVDIKPGDAADDDALNRNLRRLWNSRLFSNASISNDGGTIKISVEENPMVNQVAFEGNTEVKQDDIKTQMSTRPHSIYNEASIRKDVETLKLAYKSLGFFKANIDAKTIERSDNRYDVVFEISEGDKAYVRDISFRGNNDFSARILGDVVSSKPYGWWKIFETGDAFHEERIVYDTDQLRLFYQGNGYLDYETNSYGARMANDEESFFVSFDITEGKRYRIKDVDIKSDIPELSIAKLDKDLLLEPGMFYNEALARRSVNQMVKTMGEDGYPFANVAIERFPIRETGEVNVVFNITDSVKAFINNIEVKNNNRTYESVIRRNLTFDEQSAYNSSFLGASEQKLMGLEYFNSVKITPRRVEGTPDKIDIDVIVEEKPTGELTFGAGWSTYEQGFIEFGIKEANFRGKGQTLGFSSLFSKRQNNLAISFMEPYMLDRDLTGGFDIFYNQGKYNTIYGYDINSIGFTPKAGWSYNDHWAHRARITVRRDEAVNLADHLTSAQMQGLAAHNTYRVGQTLTYRDQVVDYVNDTRHGHTVSWGTDYAGFGGDKDFIKNDISMRQYFSFFENTWMLGIIAEIGKIEALDGSLLSSSDRYRLGGDNLRGFDYNGIGARPSLGGQSNLYGYSYGGNTHANGTFQVNFPIGFPKKARVSGYAFYDWGFLGEPDIPDQYWNQVEYHDSIRTSWGYGISWESPMGAINFSWATPLQYQPEDRLQRFLFSIGNRF